MLLGGVCYLLPTSVRRVEKFNRTPHRNGRDGGDGSCRSSIRTKRECYPCLIDEW